MNASKMKFVLLFLMGAVPGVIWFFTSIPTPLTAQVLNNSFLPLMIQQDTQNGPYIAAIPSCWTPGSPNNKVELIGGNWPTTPGAQSSITIYLRDTFGNATTITTIPPGHGGSFTSIMVNVASFIPANSPYHFVGQAPNGAYAETMFVVPCLPDTTPTPTPIPAELIISSPPTLVSTPPIIAYEPVTFSYLITNTSNVTITDMFYLDTYFDPVGVTSTTIPISYSVYYRAIDSLGAGESQIITMTVTNGFSGTATQHTVYGMVDSMGQIHETNESNNISGPLTVFVTPVTPVPPTQTPEGNQFIGGTVRRLIGSHWEPQYRVTVYLLQVSNVPAPTVVAQTTSSVSGSYFFTTARAGENYTLYACFTVAGVIPVTYVGSRTNIFAPNPYVDIFMVPSTQSCAFP